MFLFLSSVLHYHKRFWLQQTEANLNGFKFWPCLYLLDPSQGGGCRGHPADIRKPERSWGKQMPSAFCCSLSLSFFLLSELFSSKWHLKNSFSRFCSEWQFISGGKVAGENSYSIRHSWHILLRRPEERDIISNIFHRAITNAFPHNFPHEGKGTFGNGRRQVCLFKKSTFLS